MPAARIQLVTVLRPRAKTAPRKSCTSLMADLRSRAEARRGNHWHEWHSEIHKLIVELGIDKCRSPWDKDWWLHDPIPVRQGGRPCPRLHDGGFPKRLNRSTNRMFSRFTTSSTPRWSTLRWPRQASRSRSESTRRLSPSACSSPRYWTLITRAVRRSRG